MAAKCTSCGHEHADWVPKDRLETVVQQRKDLETELTSTKGQVAEWKTKWESASGDLSQLEGLKTKVSEFESKASAWAVEKSIFRAGITDDEGVTMATLAWKALPEDKRPEGGIDAWLSNSEALPKGVRAYMTSSTTTTTVEAPTTTETTTTVETPAAAGGGVPRTTSTVVPAGGQAQQPGFTREQIRAMTPEEYAKFEPQILAQINRG